MYIQNKLIRMINTQCCTYNKIYSSIRLRKTFMVKVLWSSQIWRFWVGNHIFLCAIAMVKKQQKWW